jgi:bacterioferritin
MTKIEFLKCLSKGWFATSQQHSIHAQLLKARGLGKLADKIMAESDEEWEEAKKVNARLIELGETPSVEITEYPVITDIKQMLEFDCKDAAEALPMMSKALSLFDDDYVTKHMIEEFIIDEQDHYNWLKGHLCLIEQIGMENYIIEMLGE